MQEKKPISHIVAGLIIAGLLILLSIVTSIFMGTSARPGGGWINYIILIGGLIFFINQYGKAKNNYVTFGELFSYGFKATAVLTLIFVLFLVILAFTYPELKEKAIEATREQMEKQKNATDESVETGIEMVSKYFWAVMIGGMMLYFAFLGALGSLIGAAITKKEKINPMQPLDHLDQPRS